MVFASQAAVGTQSKNKTKASTIQTLQHSTIMKTTTILTVFIAAGMLTAASGLAEPKARPAANPDPIAAAEASLKAAKAKDHVLWHYRLGVMYLRAGRPDQAKSHFDEALARVN